MVSCSSIACQNRVFEKFQQNNQNLRKNVLMMNYNTVEKGKNASYAYKTGEKNNFFRFHFEMKIQIQFK